MTYVVKKKRQYRKIGMGDGPMDEYLYQLVCVDQNSGYYDPNDARCQPSTLVVVGPNAGQTTGNPSTTLVCLGAANQATAALDGYTNDLDKNWLPSGYYAPAQVTSVVGQVMGVLSSVGSMLQQQINAAGAATSGYDVANLKDSLDKVSRAIGGSVDFTSGAQQATVNGIKQIDAPGLKRWVVSSLSTASAASNAAYVISCQTPGFIAVFNTVASVFQAAWNAIKAIGGILLDVAKDVLKIPDTIGTLITLAKWGAVAGGAYVVWREFKKSRGR